MSNEAMLILVQGLAGSGKSHLIQLLERDFLIEENFAAGNSEAENINHLIQNLKCGRRCIVSERKYRSNIEREKFISKIQSVIHPLIVRIICFENDLITANHNCRVRTNKSNDPNGVGHIAQNNQDIKDYEIPDDAIVVKIHRITAGTPTN
jgi:hypothetical protein